MAVLGFIFLMAVFVTQFLDTATRQMRMRAVEMGRTDLRMTAYSALEVTLAVMAEFNEIDEGLNRPSQGWGDPIGYAGLTWPDGVTVKVTIEDETGRIPLNPMPEADIRALLYYLDIDYSDADIMVDSLADWTDENDMHRLNGAEEDYYDREDPPYRPPNGPLTSFENLSKIRGFKEQFFDEDGNPNELYYRFISAVSLHNTNKVNINTAPMDVLAAYAGESSFDENYFDDYMSGQDRIGGNMDDAIIRSSEDLHMAGYSGKSDALGFSVAIARVRVEVSAGEKRFSLTALVDTGEGEARQGGDENSGDSQNGENNSGQNQETSGEGSGNNSSGKTGDSSFTLLRLVENANFD